MYLTKIKGTYVDGHERKDVVQYRIKFLQKMVSNEFLKDNAPTPELASCLPADLESSSQEQIKKVGIVICHDESTFQANDDESWLWGVKGPHVISPKSRGAESWFLIL